jgi:hypothetical protein
MARRRPEFEPGPAGAEAAKLNKFSDAGGTQIQWLPDAGRTDFSITSGIPRQIRLREKSTDVFAFFFGL